MAFERYTRRVLDLLQTSDLDKVSARQIRKQIQKERNIDFGPQKAQFDKFITDLYLKISEKTMTFASKSIPTFPPQSIPTPPRPTHHNVIPSVVKNVDVKEEVVEDARTLSPLTKYDSELDPDQAPTPPSRTKKKPQSFKKAKNAKPVPSEDDGDLLFESEDNEVLSPMRRKTPRKKTSSQPNNTGWNKPCKLSPQLAALLGEEELSRPQVVKRIWVYIKQNELQDPDDKRYIVPDEKLFTVLGVERVQFMTMNKYLTKHIIKNEPTGRIGANISSKSNVNGFKKLHKLSPPLALLLGEKSLPRTQVVKKLWDYIKLNKLQDQKNKQNILNDDAMFAVFSTRSMTMFEMNKVDLTDCSS
jgi:upstream activation factor subunit UAF30